MNESMPDSEPVFAAWVGIDWADQEHVWILEVADTGQRQGGKLPHTPEAIEAWAAALAARFDGRPVAVGLEQARGALVYALMKYGHLVLYPIHPATAARFRRALYPSGAKDDPRDADLLLELLLRHRRQLRPLKPDTELTRKLQNLVEKRRQLVDEKTAQTNRITGQLKLYFPQMLDWFEDIGSPLVGALLARWPTLEQLQAEPAAALSQFFRQHNCRSEARLQQRLEQIPQARPILSDRAVVEPAVCFVQALLQVVAALREGVAALDKEIEQAVAAHPDFFIFRSFPGAGPKLAPRLLAAFGSDRQRFHSAAQLASFSGIAPVISRSGRAAPWVHFRWACPKFLRQSFHEFAAQSILKSTWAREFYDRQRARGKGHHAALRSLAFKWIRILFRCWQARTPYQQELYRRPSPPHPPLQPLRPRSGKTMDLQFKKVAGLSKSVGLSS